MIAVSDRKADIEVRAIGAYLGLAVGDALGASVEFMTPREIECHFGVHRAIIGGGWLHLKRGQVTDDTEMSLALGEAILKSGHVDAAAAAEYFLAWMRSKPVDIGNTVRRGLAEYRRTGRTEMPENQFDAGNGACMRCLPVALATCGAPPDAVIAACRAQAHVTHNNPLSDAATECVVAMVQAGLTGRAGIGDMIRMADDLAASQPKFQYRGGRCENPGAYIVETMKAVFQALFSTDTFEDALIDVVNRGGDADTTGAIAGMVAGALYGPEAIPKSWIERLDAGVGVRCREQALRLVRLSPRYMVETAAT